MEEKKQTNKLSYSIFGKHFRGFLCLITFSAFCVSTILTMYSLGTFGVDIITDPKHSYTDTESYQIEMSNLIGHVLNQGVQVVSTEIEDNPITMLDMESQNVHYYDRESLGEAIYYGEFDSDKLEDLEIYELEDAKEITNLDLMDYSQMKEYLRTEDACEYIYFDEGSFRELFEKNGLKNTDYRFSDEFSEEAYFIFENYEVTTKETLLEPATEVVEENVSQEEAEATKVQDAIQEEEIVGATEVEAIVENEEKQETSTEVIDDYEVIEGNESDAAVVKKTVTQEIVITPSNLSYYAVYDPEQGIYYSTQDEYFDEMDTYIYSTEELLAYIDEQEESGSYYNSLVVPLLRIYNNGLSEVIYNNTGLYETMLAAQESLEACEYAGIKYYLEMKNHAVCSNVEDVEEILSADKYYCFEYYLESNNRLDSVEQTHGDNLPDIIDLYPIQEAFDGYYTGSIFAISFDDVNRELYHSLPWSGLINKEEYAFYRDYTLILLIVAVVTLVLLLIQAVSLLCTTGRKYKGDTEVSLNFYDRFYTEIWLVITSIILLCSVGFGVGCAEEALTNLSIKGILFWIAVGCLPFGFCFMVLTLSFSRRVKAHNLWERMLLVKLVKYCLAKIKGKKEVDATVDKGKESKIEKTFVAAWDKCKQAIYNIKGTSKLLLLFVFFMIAEIMVVFVGLEQPQYAETNFFLFIVLQVIATVAVVHVMKDIDKLAEGVKEITKGNLDSKVEINEKTSVFGELADGINHIGDGLKNAVETSLKDERMKTELITNVSHDLKTPLTSIINYVDLLKKQEMPNEDAKHYVEVLDGKAQRLKQLTEDLVEAAKATSGNIELEMMPLTFDELMKQALGEFEDKFEKKNLTIIASYPKKPAVVLADGRRLFRIIDNVLQNIYKYAMEGTRVYADLSKDGEMVTFTLKNVSAAPLNISPDELMERFTRGDSSRTTEGSGLGLSIAKDLTRLQNGEFEIQLDGDLFKVIIRFPEYVKDEKTGI